VFNIADLLVFALPFAGSVNHLCIMMGLLSSPPGQNSGFLSFSVLIVLFHFVSYFFFRFFRSISHLSVFFAFFFPRFTPINLSFRT
jgi:hypothetical protein